MIGTAIAGWTVHQVLAADGALQRYTVVRGDGTSGRMEIAAANSPAANDLVARARATPDAAIIDKGIDTFGNPYVVFAPAMIAPAVPLVAPSNPFAAPATPNVAPAIPSARTPVHQSRSKVKYYIAGAVLLLLIFNVAIRRRDKPEARARPKFAISSAEGDWGWACNTPFTLVVQTPGQARITVLGKPTATDISGRAAIELTEAQLDGVHHLDLEATSEKGEKATTRVAIPEREVKVSSGFIAAGEMTSFYDASASIKKGGKEVGQLRLSTYTYDRKVAVDPPPAGSVSFLLSACGFIPGTSEQDTAKVTITDERVRIDVDIFKLYWAALGAKEPEDFTVSVSLPSKAGEHTVYVSGRFPAITSDKALYAKWAAVARAPITDAPLPAEVATPRPIIVLTNGLLEREYLGGGSMLGAPYVVLLDNDSKVVGSCGPYGYDTYVKRYRSTARAKIYEARTGKLVGQGSFSGSAPSCPQTITTWNGSASDLYGGNPDITRWLAKWK